MKKNSDSGWKTTEDKKEFLKQLQQNEEIKFVRLWFPDILGNQQCELAVPKERITKQTLEEGLGYDGSSVLGHARIEESDKIVIPDIKTARLLPWTYKTTTEGFDKTWKELVAFVDIKNPDKSQYEGDCRFVLKKTLQEINDKMGVDKINLGPELEYFLFEANGMGRPLVKDGRPVIVDFGEYFKGGKFGEVRKESQLLMQMMGYEFEYDHHEVAFSQHETDIKNLEALEMADFVMLYKYIVRKTAKSYGLFASFMPKPIAGINGSGMHVHQSLMKNGKNIFFDKDDEYNLSLEGKRYMAGLMKYIPEITSVLNQWVNSYKRLVPGYEAPVYICWDPANRSNLIRKPQYRPGKEEGTRLELRSPDPSTNPYLAFALMIQAGVNGITEQLDVPKPTRENVYELSEEDRVKKGIKSLPESLEEALKLTEKSELVKDVLGKHLFEKFIENKRMHVKDYKEKVELAISSYELETLLPIL